MTFRRPLIYLRGSWWATFIVSVAFAQEPIRVNTRLVEVNVIARDAHGAIEGLTADSFKLFDNGKEQRIAVFKVTRALKSAEEPAKQNRVYSNRDASHDDQPRSATVFMIDTLNTEFGNQLYVKKNIQSLLNSFDPAKKLEQPIAIYLLAGGVQVLQGFTTDVGLLRKAISSFNPQMSRELEGANEAPIGRGRGSRRAAAQVRDFFNAQRVDMTLDSFKQLAQYLAPVPGRKKLIWISDAFPARYLQPDWMQPLNQADVAIYSVHARGLMVSRRDLGKDAINDVAELTGGRALINTNDFAGAIKTAMDDAEITYTLAFYPQDLKTDGNFHILKVKVDHPGTELRYRNGYFATEQRPFDKSQIADAMQRAADAPFDAMAIGLSAAMEPDARSPGALHIALHVNISDLALDNQNGKWVGAAELTFTAQSAGGRTLGFLSKTITFNLTEEAYAARRNDGLTIHQTIAAVPNAARIRVVVLDDRSGAAGSLTLDAKP
jgi:VWFA-related protein